MTHFAFIGVNRRLHLTRSQVYTFGNEAETREHPVQLPAGYEDNAHRVAEAPIAMAGYRLAAVLNDRLK
jgi:hypothetical protein